MNTLPLIAGVELGGTKAIALLARGRDIIAQRRVPTTSPAETLGTLRAQLAAWNAQDPIEALGVASFGPIRLDRAAPDYGRMLITPKEGWSGYPVFAGLAAGLDCPQSLDTDVNAAGLAEWRWGGGQDLVSLCYLTIGTGVGGALLTHGKPVHGALHPEIGHLKLRRAHGDCFAGICAHHGDCIEGLVSGPALRARFGGPPDAVADDDPQWRFVVHDLVELVCAIQLTASPQKILIGGGVGMSRPFLFDLIRQGLVEKLGGYLSYLTGNVARSWVERPHLGDNAGPLGAIALGLSSLEKSRKRQ
ncbi:MAG TPA: ROK family protein [Caulobacter sp.]|nr:ROK family protein [Caulobacter sp.]